MHTLTLHHGVQVLACRIANGHLIPSTLTVPHLLVVPKFMQHKLQIKVMVLSVTMTLEPTIS